VQQGRILAATFHPELTDDTTVHAHFLKLADNRDRLAAEANERFLASGAQINDVYGNLDK